MAAFAKKKDSQTMNIIDAVKSFIYLLSSCLLYPDLILLALLSAWVVVLAGRFAAEWMERRGLKKAGSGEIKKLIKEGNLSGIFSHAPISYIEKLREAFGNGNPGAEALEYMLQKETAALQASLDTLRIFIKTGPALGLIGTLIPMSTGLAALGKGNINSLSADLVVAFTTTVVGLFIGVSSYFIYMVRKRWIEEDVRNIEFATEILHSEIS